MKDDVVSDFAVLSEAAPAALSIIDAGLEQDLYAAATLSDVFDRALHASVARGTGGLSPAALAKAYWDWAAHLTMSPGKQMRLLEKAVRNNLRLINYVGRCALNPENASTCIDPLPHDRRFSGDGWGRPPFNLIYQGFLLNQQWWHYATTGVSGVTRRHENMVDFASRQLLDMFSPSNFLLTNPESQQRTLKSGGANLFRGFLNLLEDFEHAAGHKRVVGADAFRPGVDVATTPGKSDIQKSINRIDPIFADDRCGEA